MRKSVLAMTMLTAFMACGQAVAANQRVGSAELIQGMGERIPPGKSNVSLSPLFKVYTFEKDGLKYVQVNSLKDEVISVVVVTPGAQGKLPIGSSAEQTIVQVNDEKNQSLGMVTAAASCPCSATVVYEDASTRIVVVYGSDGTVITTIVINKVKTPSTPKPGT